MTTYKISQPNSAEDMIYVCTEQPGTIESLEAAAAKYGDGEEYVEIETVKDADEIAQAERSGLVVNADDTHDWFWDCGQKNPFGFRKSPQ